MLSFPHRRSLNAEWKSSYILFLKEWTELKYVLEISCRKNAGFKWPLSCVVGTFTWVPLMSSCGNFIDFFFFAVLGSLKNFFQYWRVIFFLSSCVWKCFLLHLLLCCFRRQSDCKNLCWCSQHLGHNLKLWYFVQMLHSLWVNPKDLKIMCYYLVCAPLLLCEDKVDTSNKILAVSLLLFFHSRGK